MCLGAALLADNTLKRGGAKPVAQGRTGLLPPCMYSGMARRTVFVIDSEGTIRWTWVGSREQPQPDYDAVIEEARKAAQSSHD